MFRRSQPGPDSGTDLNRLFAFSDGVFAIAITLLALDLKVPSLLPEEVGRLPAELLRMAPSFLSYVISFVVTGAYWNAHHRMFRLIGRYDNKLLWLNILFLMTLCFLPFPTLMINRYQNQIFPTIFYAASVALIGLMMNVMWWYASVGHRLLIDGLSSEAVLQGHLRMITPPVLFLFSIPFAYISPQVPQLIWMLAMVLRPSSRRRAPHS